MKYVPRYHFYKPQVSHSHSPSQNSHFKPQDESDNSTTPFGPDIHEYKYNYQI